jgi:hypothetical protein
MAITAFSIVNPAVAASIDQERRIIALGLPSGTDKTALVASFQTNGGSVSAGGAPQESGVTVNDFSAPLVYTVTGGDGATRDYTVVAYRQNYLKASASDGGDAFGYSIAASGDTLVVGAMWEDSSATGVDGNQADDGKNASGAAYVFVRDGSAWSQQAYLKASNSESSDFFGCSVAVSGDTIVVGAYGEDSNATGVNGNGSNNAFTSSGAAYVFARSGASWSQQAYLKASNTYISDCFGYTVAVSGDTIVVGAYGEGSRATGVDGSPTPRGADLSGAAYVFVRSGADWSQQAYLKSSNSEASDQFGGSVGIDGDTIVVGAAFEDSSSSGVDGVQTDNAAAKSGAAYIFVRNGATWTQQAYLKASNPEANDGFGNQVAISGDTVIVGSYIEGSSATGVNGDQAGNGAPNSGAVYVFTRGGAAWSQQAYLKASNTGADDLFSWSLAISGDTIVVGAQSESSAAIGVGGDQGSDGAANSGAAYLFHRNGSAWSQRAYLKATNAEAEDAFGVSVAVSGDTVAVAADTEDGSASGVNGNQADNGAYNSGAVYTYE